MTEQVKQKIKRAQARVRSAKNALTEAKMWNGTNSEEYRNAQARLKAANSQLREAHGASNKDDKKRSKKYENQK